MFVITADQVGSRHDSDRAGALVADFSERFAGQLVLPVDQTAGDEVQLVTESADTALEIVLEATRTGRWSVGLGIGSVRHPLPDAARKASGGAFIAAREAVTTAKRADGRFALRSEHGGSEHDRAENVGAELGSDGVESLVRLLVLLRERRTDHGWEVVDLMRSGLQQKEAAAALGISAAAVSARLKAALWRAEDDARPALVRLMSELDDSLRA